VRTGAADVDFDKDDFECVFIKIIPSQPAVTIHRQSYDNRSRR